ncbi:MAG: hypothetical protein CML73_00430 [Rhodobiaceae bacterium]|nr:hypothetical protein [Rhodobiaceae bacterium]
MFKLYAINLYKLFKETLHQRCVQNRDTWYSFDTLEPLSAEESGRNENHYETQKHTKKNKKRSTKK